MVGDQSFLICLEFTYKYIFSVEKRDPELPDFQICNTRSFIDIMNPLRKEEEVKNVPVADVGTEKICIE